MALKFEKLKVWQMALELSGDVHDLILHFPVEERYVLSSQLQRAADSVCLNIAEGSTGQSNPEFSRLLGFSLRSAIEVIACLHLAKRRKLINETQFTHLYEYTQTLLKSIHALRKSLRG